MPPAVTMGTRSHWAGDGSKWEALVLMMDVTDFSGGVEAGRGPVQRCYLHGESNKTMFTHKWAPPGPISCSNKIKGDGWSREQQAELGWLSAE